ncbi:MAG TPA: hypothetical protein VFH63_03520 [candidate division Zixibacteria bacterium]|nr:hypothetical protein [candidate division Zixibacteria bacterium]
MDGYSVHDAATVLGIPEARVWELIARGVLAGAPEADGSMRVFLKPAAQPVAGTPAPDRSRDRDEDREARNGNGGEGRAELSPFRELLTEFRNLTERYGQALLALGEARGEVAALRARVDMLEARIDLRLPPPRPASTVAWEMPDYEAAEPAAAPAPPPVAAPPAAPAPEAPAATESQAAEPASRAEAVEPAPRAEAVEPAPVEPGAEVEAEAAEAGAEDVKGVSRRAALRRDRIRGRRQVLGGIAEALARAEDPTLSGLPGAEEAARALAELRQMTPPEPPATPPEFEAAAAELMVEPAEAETQVPDADAEPLDAEAAQPGPEQPEPASVEVLAAEEIVPPSAVEAVPAIVLVDEEALELEAEPGAVIAEQPEPLPAPSAPEEPVEPMPAEPMPAETPTDAMPAEVTELEAEPEPVIAEEPEPVQPAAAEAATERVTGEFFAEPMPEEPTPEPEPAAEASPYTTDVVEPDWFADGDFTWLEVGDRRPGEPEPAAEVSHPTDAADAGPAPEPGPGQAGMEQRREDWWPSDERPAQPPNPDVGMDLPRTEAHQADESRPSAVATATAIAEEELMILGDEFEEAGLEIATPGWRGQATPTVPEPSAPPQGEAREEADRGADEPPSLLNLSDDDLVRLAHEEGWDMSEVEAIRTFLGRSAGSDQAPAQPEARPEPRPVEAAEPAAGPPSYAPPEVWERPDTPQAPSREGTADTQASPEPEEGPRLPRPGDPAWLRGRRGPAATAFRRLRRLFPDGG